MQSQIYHHHHLLNVIKHHNPRYFFSFCSLRFDRGADKMEDNETTLEEHICSGATDTEMELYYNMAWWLDGVVQVAMGLIGLLGNSVAIPILLSKKLNRSDIERLIYYYLLICRIGSNNTYLVIALTLTTHRIVKIL